MVNGKNDGNAVSDVGTQIMLGTLGVLLHPDPKSGLIVVSDGGVRGLAGTSAND